MIYADGLLLLLLVEEESRVEIEQKGTEYTNTACEWGENDGICVSEGKTVVDENMAASKDRLCE